MAKVTASVCWTAAKQHDCCKQLASSKRKRTHRQRGEEELLLTRMTTRIVLYIIGRIKLVN